MLSLKWILATLLICSTVSCSLVPHDHGEKVYQRFEIGNAGTKPVRNVKIVYGDLTIPHGSNFYELPAIQGTLRSESQVVPVPDVATVSWHSGDGGKHEAVVPIRQSIRDFSRFYGWKFYFVDKHVNVYLISRKSPASSRYLELVDEQVYSK